jgi:hypothetical protein
MRSDKLDSLIRRIRREFYSDLKMPVAPINLFAASRRPYFYLALVPFCCWFGWTALILLIRRHLIEDALDKAVDILLYLSAISGLVLLAVSIRFRKSVNWITLVMVSLLCGLLLAFITFVGYMRVGFGCC